MTQPSEQLIKMVRSLMQSKQMTVAKIALHTDIERGELRRVLSGREVLTVDHMFAIFNVLDIGAEDLGQLGLTMEEAQSNIAVQPPVQSAIEMTTPTMDPFGNQAEQLLRAGFELGIDFRFLADPKQLSQSGIPKNILDTAHPSGMAIQLSAAYHDHNKPEFFDTHFEVTLSFDALYRVKFPWTSISSVTFFPEKSKPTPEKKTSDDVPHLRLVT